MKILSADLNVNKLIIIVKKGLGLYKFFLKSNDDSFIIKYKGEVVFSADDIIKEDFEKIENKLQEKTFPEEEITDKTLFELERSGWRPFINPIKSTPRKAAPLEESEKANEADDWVWRNDVFNFACPQCKSTNIGQYKPKFGLMWCASCGFQTNKKGQPDNPFIVKK